MIISQDHQLGDQAECNGCRLLPTNVTQPDRADQLFKLGRFDTALPEAVYKTAALGFRTDQSQPGKITALQNP